MTTRFPRRVIPVVAVLAAVAVGTPGTVTALPAGEPSTRADIAVPDFVVSQGGALATGAQYRGAVTAVRQALRQTHKYQANGLPVTDATSADRVRVRLRAETSVVVAQVDARTGAVGGVFLPSRDLYVYFSDTRPALRQYPGAATNRSLTVNSDYAHLIGDNATFAAFQVGPKALANSVQAVATHQFAQSTPPPGTVRAHLGRISLMLTEAVRLNPVRDALAARFGAGTNAAFGAERRALVRNWAKLSALARGAAGPQAAISPAQTIGGITFDNVSDIPGTVAIGLGFCGPAADGTTTTQPNCQPPPSLLVDSVRVDEADGEAISDIYGTVRMRATGGEWVTLFDRPEHQEFGTGNLLPLQTYDPVRGGQGYEIAADLWDYDVISANDQVAQGSIIWTPDQGQGTFTKSITGQYGRITVIYRVASFKLKLTVDKAKVVNADDEDPAQVFGSIVMECGDRWLWAFSHSRYGGVIEGVHPGDYLPLDATNRHTCGSTLELSVGLYDYDGQTAFTPDDLFADGTFSFTMDSPNGTTTTNVPGPWGSADITYTVEITAI